MPVTASFNVSTADELKSAIDSINASTDGSGTAYSITVAAGVTLTETAEMSAITLSGTDSLVIHGNNATLDGGGLYDGFFVYSGTVEIDDLAINNKLAQGGNGASGGGGGAGLGGGLFAGSGSSVTLTNVTFANNAAAGGNGGNAGSGSSTGGGLNGGSGGGADHVAGGFGGGGGFSSDGGFGGGGGGFSYGGFGGGAGGYGFNPVVGGGGGLGAGGDIFVQSGATLTIAGGTLVAGTVSGGSGGTGGDSNSTDGASGSALGSSIFIHGDQTIQLGLAGTTTTVSAGIADQTGSSGTGANAGAGALAIYGGTVYLNGINTNPIAATDQTFRFLGQANFAGPPGCLIYRTFNPAGTANDKTIIYGDVNGDRRADFQIELTGLKTLFAGDFVL